MKYILQINLKAENILLSILSHHPESNIIIILIITMYNIFLRFSPIKSLNSL